MISQDFWVDKYGRRSLDKSQDWQLLTAQENATHTVLEFSRSYVTCDSGNDLQIYENEWEMMHLLFSYKFEDPDHNENIGEPAVEDIIHYNFFSTDTDFRPKETDVEEIDFSFDVRECDSYYLI